MTIDSRPLFVVGLGGTCRPGSASNRLLESALALCAEQGSRTACYAGEELAKLPIFDARDPMPHPAAAAFVETIRVADAVVIASPGYHGAMSGLVKNALDHTEALRSDSRPYLDGRPVGIVVAAAGWQACGSTLGSLRSVVHALRGWPTPLAVTVNSAEPAPEAAIDLSLRTMTEQLLGFAMAMAPVRPAAV